MLKHVVYMFTIVFWQVNLHIYLLVFTHLFGYTRMSDNIL